MNNKDEKIIVVSLLKYEVRFDNNTLDGFSQNDQLPVSPALLQEPISYTLLAHNPTKIMYIGDPVGLISSQPNLEPLNSAFFPLDLVHLRTKFF